MKKLFGFLMVMVVAMVVCGTTAEAKVRQNRYDRIMAERYTEFVQDLEEEVDGNEEFENGTISYDVSYQAMGNGLYDIVVSLVIYQTDNVDMHIIYDAVEDEELAEFVVIDEERYDGIYLEELYPELDTF